jgi:hypothetical protein
MCTLRFISSLEIITHSISPVGIVESKSSIRMPSAEAEERMNSGLNGSSGVQAGSTCCPVTFEETAVLALGVIPAPIMLSTQADPEGLVACKIELIQCLICICRSRISR